jgi:hypothetical protein
LLRTDYVQWPKRLGACAMTALSMFDIKACSLQALSGMEPIRGAHEDLVVGRTCWLNT